MKDKAVSKFLDTNVGGILLVIVPSILGFFGITYETIEDKLKVMGHFELFRITATLIIALIFYVILLVLRIKNRQIAIIEYADLLREDAAEVNNYLSLITMNRITAIQKDLLQKGIISENLGNDITYDEDRLHKELAKKRDKEFIELYEYITNKKYEPNRD